MNSRIRIDDPDVMTLGAYVTEPLSRHKDCAQNYSRLGGRKSRKDENDRLDPNMVLQRCENRAIS